MSTGPGFTSSLRYRTAPVASKAGRRPTTSAGAEPPLHHGVSQHPGARYLYLHYVPGFEPLRLAGRTGVDDVAGDERDDGTDEPDNLRDVADQFVGDGVLHHLPVHPRRQLQRVMRQAGGDGWPEDAERVAAFRPPPLAVRGLPLARGDIVAGGVAKDCRQRFLATLRSLERLADDHHNLPLRVDAARALRQHDLVARSRDAGKWLEEERGRVGHRAALQVARVVQPDADDRPRLARRQQLDLACGDALAGALGGLPK